MGDVRAGHIATDQSSIGIVGTDSGMEHRSPATWTDNLKVAGTRVISAKQEGEQDDLNEERSQCLLSFTFFVVVSLSFCQIWLALSISLSFTVGVQTRYWGKCSNRAA